jgi:hypothetical protein
MTNYAIVSKYLTDLFQEDSLVNTVIFGEVNDRELNKADIFPLVHIMPRVVQPNGGVITLSYDIAVVGVRTVPDHFQTQKIFGDNLIDNLNESYQILVNAYSKMYTLDNDYGIDMLSADAMQPIVLTGQTLLDGFEQGFVLQIKNEYVSC